jgi:hypothetical protein
MSALAAALKFPFGGRHLIPLHRGSASFFVGDVSFSLPISPLDHWRTNMIHNKTPFLVSFRLLVAVLVAGGGIARADIEVRSYANASPLGHAHVVYTTASGVADQNSSDGGSYVFAPDAAAGHYFFSSTAQAPNGNSTSTTADTAHGTLHSYVAGHGATGESKAVILETLTFVNTNAQAVPITVHWTFEGALTVAGNGLENNANASYEFAFFFGGHGNPGGNISGEGTRNAFDPSTDHDTRTVDSWNQPGSSYTIAPSGPTSFTFTGHCLLQPGQSIWEFNQGIHAIGRGFGTGIGVADFGNTVALQFELPSGVSFTSPSGLLGNGSRMLNISTRAHVLNADSVAIGGFIVSGTVPKKVIIRGIGPSLSTLGVSGAMADPTLELHQNGILATNDNWRDTQETEIQATGIPPGNDLESAIVRTLDPGSYTAILRGKNNGTGVGLIEVYDLQASVDSKLANISTRALVEAGDNVLIGGIIGGGSGSQPKVLIRAIGPSLTGLGVANALQDPSLELHDNNGALIASNNDWQSDHQAEIQATGLAPSSPQESAILATLLPTNYTAIVRGVNNTSGVGLVEVYHIQ